MKKKLVLVLMLCMGLAFSAGCADTKDQAQADTEELKEAGTETPDAAKRATIEYNAEDYVTLGDYKGLKISLNEADYQFTDEDVNSYADQMIAYTKPFVPDETKTEVGANDIVNVDYVGKKDGEPFDGGSAQDQYIDVA